MKRLITICAVVGLMLSSTCVSWAVIEPNVSEPPGAPEWWNVPCDQFAYGWWQADIVPGSSKVSPPNNETHWASNFLSNTDFTAAIVDGNVVINLDNYYNENLYKEIYIYLTGTTENTSGEITPTLNTDGGRFQGRSDGEISDGTWMYRVSGRILPQPEFVKLMLTVPGLTSVKDIWAGENCLPIPEPATVALLGLGALSLLHKRKK